MALWIMGLLAIILWRRQTLRARALQQQQQHQGNAAPGTNVPPANGGGAVEQQPAENREEVAGAAAAAAEARQTRQGEVEVEEPAVMEVPGDTVIGDEQPVE
jgi:hypothetical protein